MLAWGALVVVGGCDNPGVPPTLDDSQFQVSMPVVASSAGTPSHAEPIVNEIGETLPAMQPSESLGDSSAVQPEGRSDLRAAEELVAAPAQPAAPAVAAGNGVVGNAAGGIADEEAWRKWTEIQTALVFSGQQHGYIEPCGCTGLDKQKGGVARRMTLLKQMRAKGWEVMPMDVGEQVRRFGQQAVYKFQWTATAMRQMGYRAVGFGPSDLRLDSVELLVPITEDLDDLLFTSANVTLYSEEYVPRVKFIRGKKTIGVTTITDPDDVEVPPGGDLTISPIKPALVAAMKQLQSENCDFRVLMFFGDEAKAQKIVQEVPGFDLVVAGAAIGEPTYRPIEIPGSKTKMIL
ncbi:MAG: hypothetical protein AAFP90_24040, partial [Planctomycetota bacterium]